MITDRSTSHEISSWRKLAVFGILLLVVLILQIANRSYESEFSRHYDEAAHFVTGLMVHDFLTGLEWSSPLEYAENYYLHYPKVALGHWPPVFYLLQATWLLVLPPSRSSILLLIALLAAILAWITWRAGVSIVNWRVALTFSILLLFLPLTQSLYSVCMTEVLLAILVLLAALTWGQYLEQPRWKWSATFSALAVLAIMTKANGLALALLPPFSLLVSRRWSLLRIPATWLPALSTIILCGPWYATTLKMLSNGPLAKGPKIWYTVAAIPRFSARLMEATGPVLLGLAMVTVIVVLSKGFTASAKASGFRVAMVSLLLSVMVFHWTIPASFEARHLFIALPPSCLLALAAVDLIATKVSRHLGNSVPRLGILSLLTVVSTIAVVFEIPGRVWSGYGDVADYLTNTAELDESVVLVVSDSLGEGALISEVALRERRPGHIVLRSSKSLSRSSWDGSNYELLFNSAEELGAWLAQVPVGVIAVDQSVPRSRRPPETDLLLATLETNRDTWQEVDAFDMIRAGRVHSAAVRLFVQKDHQNLPRSRISLDLLEMLGKHITGQALEKDK